MEIVSVFLYNMKRGKGLTLGQMEIVNGRYNCS